MKNCAASNTDAKHSSQLELNLVFKVLMSSLFIKLTFGCLNSVCLNTNKKIR